MCIADHYIRALYLALMGTVSVHIDACMWVTSVVEVPAQRWDWELAAVPQPRVCCPGPPPHHHPLLAQSAQAYGTPVVKSGTDFREFTEIELTVGPAELAPAAPDAAGAAAGAAGAAAAGAAGAAERQPGSPPTAPRSLLVSARQLPGRVADSVAGLPDQMARLALRSHQRCSKWAKLAGIPALAGCNLSAGEKSSGQGSPCGSPAADTPHCLHSPSGGGPNATPEGKSAALVYEEAATASLATSLVATRPAGGGGSAAGPSGAAGSSSGGADGSGGAEGSSSSAPLLTFHCLRHIIDSELPEDPEVAEIVEASLGLLCGGWPQGCRTLRGCRA